MNDRLNELTKQIQDAIAEIKAILPVIGISSDSTGRLMFLVRDDEDIAKNFPGYFRGPVKSGSDHFRSELYATVNGVKFHTYSKLPVPAGYDMVCVANPEREAV